jgi:hypothetical protein
MIKLVAMGLVAVLGAGLGVAAPVESVASADAVELKACTGVDLKVKNQYSHKIKVKKFEYQVGGSWKTEQVPNTEVSAESLKAVASNQSLGDAEGKNITGLRITFQAWCNNSWGGDFVKTDTEIDNEQCNSSTGKVYRFDTPDGNLCD